MVAQTPSLEPVRKAEKGGQRRRKAALFHLIVEVKPQFLTCQKLDEGN
jgi:hypothetical protein